MAGHAGSTARVAEVRRVVDLVGQFEATAVDRNEALAGIERLWMFALGVARGTQQRTTRSASGAASRRMRRLLIEDLFTNAGSAAPLAQARPYATTANISS